MCIKISSLGQQDILYIYCIHNFILLFTLVVRFITYLLVINNRLMDKYRCR